MVDALLLAGGRLEADRFPGLQTANACKAELPILTRPMVWWTVRALRACPHIDRITIVGNPGLDTPDLRQPGLIVTPERDSIAANLRAGLEALPGASRVLGVSADLPLLMYETVDDLLDHAPDADVVFPYIERADILEEFPDRKWIFAHTPEGDMTGCSAFLVRPDALLSHWEWVEKLLGARRRSVLGLALLVGPSAVLKYALGRLHIADIEARMSALLGVSARGYRTRHADLAMDVDKTADIALCEDILRRRAPSQAPSA